MRGGEKSSGLCRREHALVGAAYEAALDRARWGEVLGRACELLGAHGGCYTTFSVAQGRLHLMETLGLGEQFARASERHIQNPWTSRGFISVGRVAVSDDLCPLDAFKRSSFYREVLSEVDAGHALLSVVAADCDAVTTFSLVRSESRGPFDAAAAARLERLLPHLSRATQLSLRLAEAEGMGACLAEALDRVRAALFLVDAACRVRVANRSAEELARQGALLTIQRGGLVAADEAARPKLRHAVAEAARGGAGAGAGSGGCFALRDSAGRPVDVVVSPLGQGRTPWLAGLPRPTAAVVVNGPSARRPTDESALRSAWGLTRAEARLVLALVDGDDLATVAEARGVRISTARTELKRVFDKTGCRRQSDLIRRLLRGPLAVR